MEIRVRQPIRVGDILSYTENDSGRTSLWRADAANHREVPIGIATEAIPEGAIVYWDGVKREGYRDGRRVIVGMMRIEDGVHIVTREGTRDE